jgi:hypothetical protein
VEQDNLYNLGNGLPANQKMAAAAQRIATPVSLFNCPSRRSKGPFGNYYETAYYNAASPIALLARSDYAANAGDQLTNEFYPGPGSYAEGDNPGYSWPETSGLTGVIFQRSKIRFADIQNGTSNTYLIGEKYLNPDNYLNGADPADNENMYVGFDNDICRTTFYPPMRDRKELTNSFAFGSAHPMGLNMLRCDGSVENVSYAVDPAVHRRAGNRW